jgi:hypothetical protein
LLHGGFVTGILEPAGRHRFVFVYVSMAQQHNRNGCSVLAPGNLFSNCSLRAWKRSDDASHELYRKPVSTPEVVYLIVALLFMSAAAAFL